MVAVHETSLRAYRAFAEETQGVRLHGTKFTQEDDHPAVMMTREEAQAFCRWLTEKERKEYLIGTQHVYRLPTDIEWSYFAGMIEEEGSTPFERDVSEDESFEWGAGWPPEDYLGNFADYAAALRVDFNANRTIVGYNDDFAYTSPVGYYQANVYGLYDIAGNVYEWVADDFGVGKYGVARGGSWTCYQPENLHLKFRNAINPELRSDEIGFRIVLSKEAQ